MWCKLHPNKLTFKTKTKTCTPVKQHLCLLPKDWLSQHTSPQQVHYSILLETLYIRHTGTYCEGDHILQDLEKGSLFKVPSHRVLIHSKQKQEGLCEQVTMQHRNPFLKLSLRLKIAFLCESALLASCKRMFLSSFLLKWLHTALIFTF